MYARAAVNEANKIPAISWTTAGAAMTAKPPAVGSPQKLRAGQTLFAEGDDATGVFEVSQGILKLYKLMPDGRRQIMGFVSSDSLIGITSADSYLYTAEAVTDVGLVRYSRAQFDRLVDEVPGFARRALAVGFHELNSAQDQMLLLGRKTATEKVASFLLFLSGLQSGSVDSDDVHVPMSRSDIADYLGLTVETVSRTLTKLKRDGVIALRNATNTKFVNRDLLEDIAAGEMASAY